MAEMEGRPSWQVLAAAAVPHLGERQLLVVQQAGLNTGDMVLHPLREAELGTLRALQVPSEARAHPLIQVVAAAAAMEVAAAVAAAISAVLQSLGAATEEVPGALVLTVS